MLAAIAAPAPRIGVPGSACRLGRRAGAAALRRRRRGFGGCRRGRRRCRRWRRRWRPAPARRRLGAGAEAVALSAGLVELVVGEELAPRLPHRLRVVPELLVHLLDQPGVGPEPRTRRRRRAHVSRVPVDAVPGRAGPSAGAGPLETALTVWRRVRQHRHDQPLGVRIEQPVDRQDPQRRHRRPQRERQDDARRGAAAASRRARPGRAGRGRHDGLRHRARGGQADDVAVAGPRPVRVDRPATARPTRSTSSTPPATPTSPATSTPPCRSPTWPCSWSAPSTASRSAPSRRGRKCAAAGIPRHGVRQQGGQAAGRLPPRPRPAEGDVRLRLRAARAAARRGGDASTASPTCSPTRASSTSPTASHHTEPLPGRRRRRGAPPARRARRGDRRPATTSSSSATCRATCRRPPSWSARSPTRCSTGSSSRCSCGSATTGVGVDRLADFICELGPSPADRPTTVARRRRRRRRRGRGRRRPVGQAARLRVQDRRRPVRRPGLAVQGAVGHDRRRRPPRQHDERRRGAPARAVPPARQGAPHRRPGRRRRPRRRRQARRHADRVDAGAEGLARARRRPRRSRRRSFGLALKPLTQSDDDKLSGALQRLLAGGSGARRRAQRGDRPDGAARHRRHPPRRGARAAGPQVRRQRRDRGRAGAVPGDDHRLGRGRGQGQEAVRRARPVRRRQPAGQPDGARRGHRVRQLDRRRHDPQAVHPGRAARRRGDDGHAAACTASRSSTCASSATTASSTPSTRPTWRSARPPPHGLKEALQKAGAAVLEPVSLLTVTVPEGYQGDVLGDLNSRRGRVSGTSRARQRARTRSSPSCRRRRSSATPSSCAR